MNDEEINKFHQRMGYVFATHEINKRLLSLKREVKSVYRDFLYFMESGFIEKERNVDKLDYIQAFGFLLNKLRDLDKNYTKLQTIIWYEEENLKRKLDEIN